MFSVIVPSRNWSNLSLCVGLIRRHEGPDAEIIIVDDGLDLPIDLPPAFHTPTTHWVRGIKPFVFARNVNHGVTAVQLLHQDWLHRTFVIMNDDALLQTQYGLTSLCYAAARERASYGVVSAGITDACCNPKIRAQVRPYNPADPGLEQVTNVGPMAPFICVAIRGLMWAEVGGLDERYVDYGFDDDDFCRTVRKQGKAIGVYKGCVVAHGSLPSTFRSTGHCPLEPNKARFLAKWGDHEGADVR